MVDGFVGEGVPCHIERFGDHRRRGTDDHPHRDVAVERLEFAQPCGRVRTAGLAHGCRRVHGDDHAAIGSLDLLGRTCGRDEEQGEGQRASHHRSEGAPCLVSRHGAFAQQHEKRQEQQAPQEHRLVEGPSGEIEDHRV